ncbi:MAG: hypothetical protein HYZ53_12945 [Planctomycetes bacterium]|nr:hypothetical protein [Planctomycetota bacterium]
MLQPNQKIRVVLKRDAKEDPLTVMRGDVTGCDEVLLTLKGRRYAKVMGTHSDRSEEKPLDESDKTYLLPWSSVRFVEMIQQGTREEELDQRVRRETMRYRKGTDVQIE